MRCFPALLLSLMRYPVRDVLQDVLSEVVGEEYHNGGAYARAGL